MTLSLLRAISGGLHDFLQRDLHLGPAAWLKCDAMDDFVQVSPAEMIVADASVMAITMTFCGW